MLSKYNFPQNPLSSKSGLTLDFMKENGVVYWREVGDEVHVVYDFGYNGRLCMDSTLYGYEDFYCFGSVQLAVDSLNTYADELEKNPDVKIEPEGWHRHFKTGRRRPDGNKNAEYINF